MLRSWKVFRNNRLISSVSTYVMPSLGGKMRLMNNNRKRPLQISSKHNHLLIFWDFLFADKANFFHGWILS